MKLNESWPKINKNCFEYNSNNFCLQDIFIIFKIKTYGSKKLLRDKIKKKIANRKEISNDNVPPAGAANIENKIGGKRNCAIDDHVTKRTKKKTYAAAILEENNDDEYDLVQCFDKNQELNKSIEQTMEVLNKSIEETIEVLKQSV